MNEYELGERAMSAIYEENSGNQHHRRNVVNERAFTALVKRALGE